MAGQSPGLTKNFVATGAIPRRRIVKFGASDAQISLATAAADLSIGVTTEMDAADGERADVHLSGLVPVEFGGNVARGAKLTADASGRAITAAPAAGANAQIIGTAMVSGVLNDIGFIHLAPSVMQG